MTRFLSTEGDGLINADLIRRVVGQRATLIGGGSVQLDKDADPERLLAPVVPAAPGYTASATTLAERGLLTACLSSPGRSTNTKPTQ
jgi:hypothetical protein